MLSRHLRVALTVAAAGAVLLAVLSLTGRGDTQLDRATTAQPPPTTPATGLTTTTTFMDDEHLVRKLAERYLEAVNENDDTTVAELNCAKTAPGLLQIAADGQPVTMTGELERAPVRDRYYVELTIGGTSGQRMTIVRQDGAWCVHD